MRARYVWPGILGLALAGGAWIAARPLPFQPVGAGLGPAFFPTLLIGLLALSSLGLILQGVFTRLPPDEESGPGVSSLGLPAAMVLLLGLFGLTVERLAATPSVFVFLFAAMILLGEPWPRALVWSAVATAAIWVLFGLVFGLPIFRFP